MAPEARRESILDAATPLIFEHGYAVTTRQIADAAGIAEGTIFRAFEDKDALLDALVERLLRPEPTLAALETIDLGLPLEDRLAQIVEILRARVADVTALMRAIGPRHHGRRPHRAPLSEVTDSVTRIVASDAEQLRVPVATAAEYVRILVVGTSVPFLAAGEAPATRDLVDFILRGIAQERD